VRFLPVCGCNESYPPYSAENDGIGKVEVTESGGQGEKLSSVYGIAGKDLTEEIISINII